MKTKLLGLALVLSLFISPVLAQEEPLLQDESTLTTTDAGAGEDLFGADFFGDLDSFLDESTNGVTTEDPLAALETVDTGNTTTIANESGTESLLGEGGETLQSSATTTTAGTLPSSAKVTLSVINVSQENADATASGARPGDVLRYEVTMNSASDDVLDYVAVVDVSGIENVVEFTNTGFGVLANGKITYPAYSNKAPCVQVFTFFVRVREDCKSLTALSVLSPEAGAVSVPLSCDLSQTGPSQRWFLWAGTIMLLFVLMFGFSFRKKTS